MSNEESNVKSGMKKDFLWQEPPVDSPLIQKDSAKVESTLLKSRKKIELAYNNTVSVVRICVFFFVVV